MTAVRHLAAPLITALHAFAELCESLEDLRVEKARRAR